MEDDYNITLGVIIKPFFNEVGRVFAPFIINGF
jgi:hypothetical protein